MEEKSSSDIDPLFWLPSDFITDDDEDNPTTLFSQLPTEFPYDFTELTRHFASEEKWGLLASPQSILSPVLSNGSPNGPSYPTAPFSQKTDQFRNLICADAGEVNMGKMNNQTANKNRALPTPPNYFTPLPSSNKITPVKQNNGSVWGHPFGVSAEYDCGFSGNPRFGRAQSLFQFGWPTSQVQKQRFNANGSVSHPTFLFPGGRSNTSGGGVGLKRKCAGTGVFLPRTCPEPTHSKVKPDAMLMGRSAVLVQQWRNGMIMVGNGAMNCDLFLPLEWSY